ncbi:MAG: hypothetical protein ACWA49_01950, partial [Ruegeria sp.]
AGSMRLCGIVLKFHNVTPAQERDKKQTYPHLFDQPQPVIAANLRKSRRGTFATIDFLRAIRNCKAVTEGFGNDWQTKDKKHGRICGRQRFVSAHGFQVFQ